jgi:hypothetical protein
MTFPDYFYPSSQLISSISLDNPAIVTTFAPHGYLDSLVVRIVIPSSSRTMPFALPQNSLGMPQISGKIGQITVLGPHTFSFPIDSTKFTPYLVTAFPVDDRWCGQVIPIAQNALALTQDIATSTTINNNNIIPEYYPPAPYPAEQ